MSSYRPDRHRAFVAGIAYHQSFAATVIGGVHDHVHALLLLPPSLALAEAIQILKGSFVEMDQRNQLHQRIICPAGGLRRFRCESLRRPRESFAISRTRKHITRRKALQRSL